MRGFISLPPMHHMPENSYVRYVYVTEIKLCPSAPFPPPPTPPTSIQCTNSVTVT